MEHIFSGEKLSQRKEQKIREALHRLEEELGTHFEIQETPDTITVRDEHTNRTFGFTKMGEKLPVGNNFYDIEKVIEATLRFPDDIEKGIEEIKK